MFYGGVTFQAFAHLIQKAWDGYTASWRYCCWRRAQWVCSRHRGRLLRAFTTRSLRDAMSTERKPLCTRLPIMRVAWQGMALLLCRLRSFRSHRKFQPPSCWPFLPCIDQVSMTRRFCGLIPAHLPGWLRFASKFHYSDFPRHRRAHWVCAPARVALL